MKNTVNKARLLEQDGLIASLRELAAARHDDKSVAADGAAEIERLRKKSEDLVVALMGIERMAAGAVYSQAMIWTAAMGALKEWFEEPQP